MNAWVAWLVVAAVMGAYLLASLLSLASCDGQLVIGPIFWECR